MFAILQVLGRLIVDVFRPRIRLEAENLFLRHQLTIAMPYREPKTVMRICESGDAFVRCPIFAD
jgi:hypothetical protein